MRNAIFKIIDLIGGYLNEDEDVKSLFSLAANVLSCIVVEPHAVKDSTVKPTNSFLNKFFIISSYSKKGLIIHQPM